MSDTKSMLTDSKTGCLALTCLPLAYVSAFLWMCILNPTQEKLTVFYSYVIEGLFSLTFFAMILVLAEKVFDRSVAFMAFLSESRSSMENAAASYYTVSRAEILNDAQRQKELHDVRMEVYAAMKAFIKLQTENHVSLKNIHEKIESETGSDHSINSNDDQITNNSQKNEHAKDGGSSPVSKGGSELSSASTA